MNETEVPFAGLSGKLSPVLHCNRISFRIESDPSRKEGYHLRILGIFRIPVDSKIKIVGPVQEEIPFFREKQAEPGEVDLSLIDFRLGKIGIDRQVPLLKKG